MSSCLSDLKERILKCCHEVHRSLKHYHQECIYQNALAVEFNQQKLSYDAQPSFSVNYKGHDVGIVKPDFVVWDPNHPMERIILEIKAVKANASSWFGQCSKYESVIGMSVMTYNFGNAIHDMSPSNAVKVVLDDSLP